MVPSEARIWIYPSNRPFNTSELAEISATLSAFTKDWKAHQQLLDAGFEIRHSQFIVIWVNEQKHNASGCSIDGSVRTIKAIEEKYQVELFNRWNMHYITEGQVHTVSKEDFQQNIEKGIINKNTLVFNHLIQYYKQLESEWCIPFEKSWHQNVFEMV
jgi:hypothetical protein